MSDSSTSEWSDTFPTKPGWYWLYMVPRPRGMGFRSHRLSVAEVRQTEHLLMIISNGEILYEKDKRYWYDPILWLPIKDVPAPPVLPTEEPQP